MKTFFLTILFLMLTSLACRFSAEDASLPTLEVHPSSSESSSESISPTATTISLSTSAFSTSSTASIVGSDAVTGTVQVNPYVQGSNSRYQLQPGTQVTFTWTG